MRGADSQARAALDRGFRLFLHATIGPVVDRAGDFGAIDALGFAFEFEFDFVVGNIAHHAFGVVEAFAVFLEHGDHVVGEVLAAHFVPLRGERAVQLTQPDHGNLRDGQRERFAARGFGAARVSVALEWSTRIDLIGRIEPSISSTVPVVLSAAGGELAAGSQRSETSWLVGICWSPVGVVSCSSPVFHWRRFAGDGGAVEPRGGDFGCGDDASQRDECEDASGGQEETWERRGLSADHG